MPLRSSPLHSADTLGRPLPDEPTGVSVSLPLWDHVIGYEEGHEAVVSRFQSGYPRFCTPPAIAQLFAQAEAEHGGRCIVFPRLSHAERAVAFVTPRCPEAEPRAIAWRGFGLLCVTEAGYKTARLYWRYCGEVISTRQAAVALGQASQGASAEEGRAASAVLRQRLAEHAGQSAEDIFLFPSGMAAIFAAHRMVTALFPGRKTAQLEFPYVDALKVQQEFGSGVHFLPVMDDAGYEQLEQILASEPLSAVFSEVPTNPLLRCVDYPRLLEMRQKHQPWLPIILDDTVGTSIHVDAMRAADAVTTSLTKSFSGAGNVLAGCLILNHRSPHHAAFAAFLREHADHELFPDDAVTLLANSADYPERMATVSENSLALAAMLRSHPMVRRVWHSSTDGGPGYRFLQRADGHGCLLSFVLHDPSLAPRFYDALEVCKGPSLGNNFTLACPYTLLAHYSELDWAAECGVEAHLLRVSVGLEPQQDLLQRFAKALDVARPVSCESCGSPDAERIADRQLCLDCYTLAGSCCAEQE
jgi:cystathionine gamma-synthase